MRKCLRCGIEMVENGCPRVASGWPIAIAKDSLYGKKLGELCCAVCPKCGYVEFYIKDTAALQKKIIKGIFPVIGAQTAEACGTGGGRPGAHRTGGRGGH